MTRRIFWLGRADYLKLNNFFVLTHSVRPKFKELTNSLFEILNTIIKSLSFSIETYPPFGSIRVFSIREHLCKNKEA